MVKTDKIQEEFDIRIVLRPKNKRKEDDILYKNFLEIKAFLSPIKNNEIMKYCIKKAYDEWFLKEIKSGKKNIN